MKEKCYLKWRKNYHLADMLISNEIKCETGLWVSSPSNGLAAVLPDTSVVSLQRYFRAAKGSNSNDDLLQSKNEHNH